MNLRRSIENGIFFVSHPIRATRAGLRQFFVGADHEGPPHTVEVEKFCLMSLREADAVIRAANPSLKLKTTKGGIQLADYSSADQTRILRGEIPRGTPLHRNL